MGRPRKPTVPPPPRDPFEAWGDVPTDQRAERKRLARIVARNGRRIASYRTFCRELGRACHEVNGAIYERTRYDHPAAASGLEDFAQKMADACEALRNPGADVAEALHSVVAAEGNDPPKDSPWRHLEPRELTLFPPSWEERAEWGVRLLADFERWAKTARDAIGTRGRGRPQDDVARTLVRRLGEIWRAETGRAPTLITDADTQEKYGDFLAFCEAVITPIWRNRGLEPPCTEAFVRDYCYPLR
jgi:hypothetical protein